MVFHFARVKAASFLVVGAIYCILRGLARCFMLIMACYAFAPDDWQLVARSWGWSQLLVDRANGADSGREMRIRFQYEFLFIQYFVMLMFPPRVQLSSIIVIAHRVETQGRLPVLGVLGVELLALGIAYRIVFADARRRQPRYWYYHITVGV